MNFSGIRIGGFGSTDDRKKRDALKNEYKVSSKEEKKEV